MEIEMFWHGGFTSDIIERLSYALNNFIDIERMDSYTSKLSGSELIHVSMIITDKTKYNKAKLTHPKLIEYIESSAQRTREYKKEAILVHRHKVPRDQYE